MARRKHNQRNKHEEETLVDIVEVRDQAQGFLESNQTLILGALLALVLIVGGIFAYNNYYKIPRNKEASEQMVEAQKQFDRDSFALALTNPGNGYPGFLDIIADYGGTDAANLANYYAGVSYLYLGQYDAALDYLKDFDADGDLMPIMKAGTIGDTYAELGQNDKAEEAYEDAISVQENDVLTPYYLRKLGLFYEANGRTEEAQEAYQRIVDEFPQSNEGTVATKYLARVQ